MGPCITCRKPGSFGVRHPDKPLTLWACAEHRAALPKVRSHDYAATETEDVEAAMMQMAVELGRLGCRDEAKAIGRERLLKAFNMGLAALDACRRSRLEP